MNVYYSVNLSCEIYFIKKTTQMNQYWFNSLVRFKLPYSESGQWIKTYSACVFDRWFANDWLIVYSLMLSQYMVTWNYGIY